MIEVFSDFDGTLTNQDTLVLLLHRFANRDWYAIEERMLSGAITELDGVREELGMICAPDEQLMQVIDNEIEPADGLDEFMSFVQERGWRMTVLSGGLIRFSGALWDKWGYGNVPLYANDHRRDSNGCIEVISAVTPRIKNLCNHCKRWHLEEAIKRGSKVIYIGDGLTDFCPAEAAHRRYAKGNLLQYLHDKNLEVVEFKNLHDIVNDLSENPI
ncbi:hypothetical protein CEE37_13340 [candidate division LCP-89 bacterium B3_LCP]|uniref:2,3-diketo-5-methylthio-1-phosphopentane phosphatase n=1 Tax=candidate division LCP-89 bacterium B3_LCP TaxID=2012998 RepID=A0A532USN0_UNCL8|nr:MAG: hypothetical protein CEE37_13340 [candidate division LCP-89 bacterium B3_LCP]